MDFVEWIAHNPRAGAVIPFTAGLRKVHWSPSERVRRPRSTVIYCIHQEDGRLWLLAAHDSSRCDEVPLPVLRLWRHASDETRADDFL